MYRTFLCRTFGVCSRFLTLVRRAKSYEILAILAAHEKDDAEMNRTPCWWSLPESKRFSLLRSRRDYYASASYALNTRLWLHEWRESRNREEGAWCQWPCAVRAMMFPVRRSHRGGAPNVCTNREIGHWSRGHWTKAGPTCCVHTYMSSLSPGCGYRVSTK